MQPNDIIAYAGNVAASEKCGVSRAGVSARSTALVLPRKVCSFNL
jgi:hypothetical protein